MRKPWDLRERMMEFAVATYRFCRTLPRTDEGRESAGQLRRAASSETANYRASRRSKSHQDFASKIGTVIEEADEALFWLDFLVLVDLATASIVKPLSTEANELVSIFTTAQKTARSQMGERRR
jgi:four helix bundle protein